MTIVAASSDDLGELGVFARRTYEDAFGGDMDREALDHHLATALTDERIRQMLIVDAFFLHRESGRLIGFVQVGRVTGEYAPHVANFDPDGAEIRRLYVLAGRQRGGIGSALLAHALLDPRVSTCRTVYLTTWETNLGAQKLYRRHGFEKVGNLPEYHPNGALAGFEHIMARTVA